MTAGIIILVALVALGLILIGIYNRLVGLRQNCRQGNADIDAQLRQRYDLIPNLVETVKGYAAHEQDTFEQVIAARNRAESNVSAESEKALSGALGKLFALSEAYPDLKASANFQALQGELADVEDKLAAARRALNAASAGYNTVRESFPAVLFAGMFGFEPFAFNQLADSERSTVGAAPQVSFDAKG
jgi:LemA protein